MTNQFPPDIEHEAQKILERDGRYIAHVPTCGLTVDGVFNGPKAVYMCWYDDKRFTATDPRELKEKIMDHMVAEKERLGDEWKKCRPSVYPEIN